MSSSIPNPKTTILRTFTIPTSATDTISVTITEPPHIKADNLSLETWASSQILASALHTLDLGSTLDIHHHHHPAPRAQTQHRTQRPGSDHDDDPHSQKPDAAPPLPVLEIGAGTALVGLTAAAMLNLREPAVFTDLSGIVPGIEANIQANAGLFRSPSSTRAGSGVSEAVALRSIRPRAGALDWRSPERISLFPCGSIPDDGTPATTIPSSRKARVVFAADVVYDENHPELLEKVVGEWLEREARAIFVICWPLRVAYLDIIREVWARMEGLGLEAVREGRETGEETNGADEMLCEWVVWKWRDLSGDEGK